MFEPRGHEFFLCKYCFHLLSLASLRAITGFDMSWRGRQQEPVRARGAERTCRGGTK